MSGDENNSEIHKSNRLGSDARYPEARYPEDLHPETSLSVGEQRARYKNRRQAMVDMQIARRGIESAVVLEALRQVPREFFLPPDMHEFAYQDTPLPITEQQTISQPYIVAYMLDKLQLTGGGRVLEVGTGSGYAAAVLAEIADQVISLERFKSLADNARETLHRLHYDNIEVIHTDGTLGWPKGAPYTAIIVAAGGPSVPRQLKDQLAIGGRLVIPVGDSETEQSLVRITRVAEDEFHEERLSRVRFVPLVGTAGWQRRDGSPPVKPSSSGKKPSAQTLETQQQVEEVEVPQPDAAMVARPLDPSAMTTSALIADAAEPIDAIDTDDVTAVLKRIGNSRIVLIGEASHGTSEFYRYRARLTRALIEQKGFEFVAVEADWPDAARVDHYVRHMQTPPAEWTAFSRFPVWMWRNEEVREFVEWLRAYNADINTPEQRVGFYGLDLYSLFTSITAVLTYLEQVDPQAAGVARERYGCLTPFQSDPVTYGRAALTGRHRGCENEVVAMLTELLNKRLEYTALDGSRFMDAVQNARLITNAERYYRSLYSGDSNSWNLRDQHMFDTLQALLAYGGSNGKVVVWEHNSHIGDASATDMHARGQHNIGQLCREAYGNQAYLIGFGTHTGTVAAANDWGDPMEVKQVQPSLNGSWERLCHDAQVPAFRLPLRHPANAALSRRLRESQLERAIGVIYRPRTERASHYFKARLADQFDEYIWFDQTRAVTPLPSHTLHGVPDTYPFGV